MKPCKGETYRQIHATQCCSRNVTKADRVERALAAGVGKERVGRPHGKLYLVLKEEE